MTKIIEDRIVKELSRIEKEKQVGIIYACESGSRAWGFPSIDSDYDVRFIYAHDPEWYISIEEKRDVIEQPMRDVLDVGGWDIRKALRLLKKSNSPLLEWMSSPIVYKKNQVVYEKLSRLAGKAFLPETSCHHYLSMARNSFAKLNEGITTEIKTYMYTLRPLLCCKWIVKHMSQPPMMIVELMKEFWEESELYETVSKLIDTKKHGREKVKTERSEIVEKYIQDTFEEISSSIPKNSEKVKVEVFDEAMREVIWGSNRK